MFLTLKLKGYYDIQFKFNITIGYFFMMPMPDSFEHTIKYAALTGAGMLVVPVTVTLLIASSKIILVDVIANGILSFFIPGVRINFYGVSLLRVPLLWKISQISAMVGGGVLTCSIIAFLANAVYHNPKPFSWPRQIKQWFRNINY
jgi:hypothetical protein